MTTVAAICLLLGNAAAFCAGYYCARGQINRRVFGRWLARRRAPIGGEAEWRAWVVETHAYERAWNDYVTAPHPLSRFFPPPTLAHFEEPPTLRSLWGIAPDLTGGVDSVAYVRRQRDAEPFS